MAQEKPQTPEKQLLNLIEQPRGSGQAQVLKRQGFGLFSLGALKGRFAFFKHRMKSESKGRDSVRLDIKVINTLLKTMIVVLAVYLFYTITSSLSDLKKDFIAQIKTGKDTTQTTASGSTPLLKAAVYYLEKVRGRDLFTMEPKKLTSDAGSSKAVTSKIIEATKNFNLVGISWSPDPDVMIEDSASKRTFFLKKGQLIDNKIRLKAVFKDKVILSYAGEEIELR